MNIYEQEKIVPVGMFIFAVRRAMAKRGKIEIDRDLCKGCLLCVRACPVKVLEADTEFNSSGSYPSKPVNPDKCIACGNCYEVCPDVCIRVFELGEQEA
jgi:2-oxoglutarate ferredoxin oxidoreductase subunit delta